MDGFEAALGRLSIKNGHIYVRLMLYIERFGSAPAEDGPLRQALGVTGRYFREKAWPILQDIFELRDGRLYHPELQRGRAPRQQAMPEPERPWSPGRRSAARKAANTRWGNVTTIAGTQGDAVEDGDAQASADASAHASTHAPTHANGMDLDASAHAKRMRRDAFARMISASPDASADAFGASLLARANSLSLSSSLTDSLPSHTDSEREFARGREGEHASGDASAHAPEASTHAPGDAPGMRSASGSSFRGRSEAPASKLRMRPDWQPSPAGEKEAQRRGLDLAATVDKFRNHWMARGDAMADFNPLFLGWCREERKTADGRQQGHMLMPIDGTARSAALDDAAAAAPGPEGQLARAKQRLRGEIGDADYRVWVAPVALGGIHGEEATICLPRRFLRDRVVNYYADRLLAWWQHENALVRRLRVEVAAKEQNRAGG